MLRSLILGILLLVGACSEGTEQVESTQPPDTGAETTVTAPVVTPETVDTAPPDTTTTTLAPTTTVPTTSVNEIDLSVVEGEVAEITAKLDQDVRITIRSETVDEVHLHGYDLHADVGPGTSGVLEFVASIPGIFEIEFEDAGTLIAELRVDP